MSSRLLSGRYELLEKIGDGGMAVVNFWRRSATAVWL